MKANQTVLLFVIVIMFFHYRAKKETFINTLKWHQPTFRFKNNIPMKLENPSSQYVYRPGMFTSFLRSDVSRFIKPILNEINRYYRTRLSLGNLLWVKVKYYPNAKEYYIRSEVRDNFMTQIIEVNIIILSFCGKYHVNYIHFPQTHNSLSHTIKLFDNRDVIVFNSKSNTDLSLLTPVIDPSIYPNTSIERRFDTLLQYSSDWMKRVWIYMSSKIC